MISVQRSGGVERSSYIGIQMRFPLERGILEPFRGINAYDNDPAVFVYLCTIG